MFLNTAVEQLVEDAKIAEREGHLDEFLSTRREAAGVIREASIVLPFFLCYARE